MHAVQLGGSHYAQYLGMSAGVAALIISCQPLLTAAVASRFLNERLAPGQWAGVLIGLAGVALVVWHKIDIREVTPGSSRRSRSRWKASSSPGRGKWRRRSPFS